MNDSGSLGAVRIGDRVRFDGSVRQVVGLEGTVVRLVAEDGTVSLVAGGHLMAAADFELLDARDPPRSLPPFALLDTLSEAVVEQARFLERHIVEMLTGLPPDAEPGTRPRADYDPGWKSLGEREVAKAAELAAMGRPLAPRSLDRMQRRYQAQGLWGLVDQRMAKVASPTGRADERVVAALTEAIAGQTEASTGNGRRLWRLTEEILTNRHGEGVVAMPSRATFYRLLGALSTRQDPFGSAVARRRNANRPDGPFTPTMATRPGEIVQVDSTVLDVMAVLDDGVTARPELTIAVDIATRTICAALLRPAGTKAVDAAVLLARCLVPEPMRPGWAEALRMARSVLPHTRLLGIDERLAQAAAKPLIVPDTLVIDHGKVFVSQTFTAACSLLGISVQPARPKTPTDKSVVERTFSSINSLFCQHVAGYTGSDVTRRGADPAAEAVWTLPQLQDLLDEWVICWQNRPHEGLRSPYLPGRTLSPNEAYTAAVARAGYLPVVLSGADYVELLPAVWRSVNDYGVRIDYRTYDGPQLNPFRRQSSGVEAKRGLWEVHYDPYDVTRIWLRAARGGPWVEVPWTHLPMVGTPFADFTWRHARRLLADRGLDDTSETALARVLADLLGRAGKPPPAGSAQVLARTRAAGAASPLGLPAAAAGEVHRAQDGQDQDTEPADEVVPFGVFDPLSQERPLW